MKENTSNNPLVLRLQKGLSVTLALFICALSIEKFFPPAQARTSDFQSAGGSTIDQVTLPADPKSKV